MDLSRFEIRPILPDDKMMMINGFARLSTESIRQRFFSHKKEFTETELKFLTEVDQLNHIAFVAIDMQESPPSLAGVIRSIKNLERPLFAEIGIIIGDPYQGMGLGTKLFNKIAEEALLAGISHFYGDYHTSNTKLIRLLEKFAKNRGPLSIKHKGGGFIYFEAPLKNC